MGDFEDSLASLAASIVRSECWLASSLMQSIGTDGTQLYIEMIHKKWVESRDFVSQEIEPQSDGGLRIYTKMKNARSGLSYSLWVWQNPQNQYTFINAQHWYE